MEIIIFVNYLHTGEQPAIYVVNGSFTWDTLEESLFTKYVRLRQWGGLTFEVPISTCNRQLSRIHVYEMQVNMEYRLSPVQHPCPIYFYEGIAQQ